MRAKKQMLHVVGVSSSFIQLFVYKRRSSNCFSQVMLSFCQDSYSSTTEYLLCTFNVVHNTEGAKEIFSALLEHVSWSCSESNHIGDQSPLANPTISFFSVDLSKQQSRWRTIFALQCHPVFGSKVGSQ